MTMPFAKTSFPEIYERALVPAIFRPFAEHLLDAAGVAPGDRVLDVGCGTGIVARLARERLGGAGTVVGVDLSAPMVAVARGVEAGIDWREGDATALPLRDGERFDVALCQQGIQFFPDRAAAARAMHAALAPGGRIAVSTWRPDEEVQMCGSLRGIAERRLGPIVDRRHAFGAAGPLAALLEDAGFRDVQVETVARTVRFADGEVFVRLNAMALVGMADGADHWDEDERARLTGLIAADSAGAIAPFADGKGVAFDMLTNVATARAG